MAAMRILLLIFSSVEDEMKKQEVPEPSSPMSSSGDGSSSSRSSTSSIASAETRILTREEKEKYLPLFLRRPISSATEQPTRFTPAIPTSGVGAYGYAYSGMTSCWPQPTGLNISEVMMPGGLPTISWLCSCEFCVNSVQEFIAALNNSNGMYAACIASSGPVYNELLASGIHMPSPATGKLVPQGNEAASVGENHENGAATTISSSAAIGAGKRAAIPKATPTLNGYGTETIPYYTLPMAPSTYMGYGMQASGMMFYNNNYWTSSMNMSTLPYMNGHGNYYSSGTHAYDGDLGGGKENDEVETPVTADNSTIEEEIDVVGEQSLDNDD